MNSGIPFLPQNLETSHLGVLLYVSPVYWAISDLLPCKDMKLVQFSKNDDWGTDYSVALVSVGRYTLFQGMICIGENPGWPYFHVSMGMGKLFEFCFDVHRFGIFFEIGARRWARPRDRL